jgi:hypothetical protein
MLYSVWVGGSSCQDVVGSEKSLYRMVRSQKLLLIVPPYSRQLLALIPSLPIYNSYRYKLDLTSPTP